MNEPNFCPLECMVASRAVEDTKAETPVNVADNLNRERECADPSAFEHSLGEIYYLPDRQRLRARKGELLLAAAIMVAYLALGGVLLGDVLIHVTL